MAEIGRGAPFLEARHGAFYAKARRAGLARLSAIEDQAERDVNAAGKKSIAALASVGLLRPLVPKTYGGSSETVEARSVISVREGVAYGSGLADAMVALQGLGSLPLTIAGTDDQRTEWLPKIARGRAISAFAVTEPDAGSDVASMATRARATKSGWEIDGTKTFISNAGIADYYALFAKTDVQAGAKGISGFLVAGDARGLRSEPLVLLSAHPVGTLRLVKVKVGREDLIGTQGDGLRIALGTLDIMRPSVAAAACGFAQRAFDEAVQRAGRRKQFGRPIGDNQGLRWKLAEAATQLMAARQLVYRAGWLKDRGQERITLEASQAKLFATEMAQRVVDLALQVHGGSGTIRGSIVERLYREVRALRIYEGTSEILRDLIARATLPASST